MNSAPPAVSPGIGPAPGGGSPGPGGTQKGGGMPAPGGMGIAKDGWPGPAEGGNPIAFAASGIPGNGELSAAAAAGPGVLFFGSDLAMVISL